MASGVDKSMPLKLEFTVFKPFSRKNANLRKSFHLPRRTTFLISNTDEILSVDKTTMAESSLDQLNILFLWFLMKWNSLATLCMSNHD